MTTDSARAEGAIRKEVVYDGEQYDRETLGKLIEGYHSKHQSDLERLAELRQSHDAIAAEMTKDLAEARSAWDVVRDMVTDDFNSNFRELLEKIPVINEFVAERPLSELLREKVEVAEKRTKEVGLFLTTIERNLQDLRDDIVRLNKKVIVAAENEETAAKHVLLLKDLEAELRTRLDEIPESSSAERRKLDAEIGEVRQQLWHHGAKLRLFSSAEDRIAAIVRMNNNFLEILENLHGNMRDLHDAGLEVLDELRGNLSGLATAAEASELSMEMQESMQSLKKSVNKIAVLASSTALYLTQNVERMTSELNIYDEATQSLVESNLQAEREIQENRIDETIALAEKEYTLMKTAREDGA